MASHCYLVGPTAELFVEYLVRHCALSEHDRIDLKSSQAKIGSIYPTELRATCERGLLLTITIPEMEHVLCPFLLKMIIPRAYTGAVAMVCRCIAELCRHRSYNNNMFDDCKDRSYVSNPEELFARLVVLSHNPLAREQQATQILTVLCYLAPLFPRNINLFWKDEFLAESLDEIQDTDWVISLGNAFAKQYALYTPDDEHSALLHRY